MMTTEKKKEIIAAVSYTHLTSQSLYGSRNQSSEIQEDDSYGK